MFFSVAGGCLLVDVISGFVSEVRRRRARRFRITWQEAQVAPDTPFGQVASCPMSPGMRFDFWLGRRPHLCFAGRVDESEGSKRLIRVGFETPEDPMGAYRAMVAAREAVARRRRLHSVGA